MTQPTIKVNLFYAQFHATETCDSETKQNSKMPNAREILTLQFGNYSNYIGTHWWNIQVIL